MNDSGMSNPMAIMAPPQSPIWFFPYPAIIHAAIADMDATYGAYVAAENITFNDTNDKDKHSNASPVVSPGPRGLDHA